MMAIEGTDTIANVPYCGVLESIMEVDYGLFKVVLLGAKWYKVVLTGRNVTVQHDECSFMRVKTTRTQHSHRVDSDVWVYPSQVDQFYYVPLGPLEPEWSIVVLVFPRARRCVQELANMQDENNNEIL